MELLTLTEAAAAAGVSDRTLRKYDRAGRISRVEGPDGRPHYPRDQAEALRFTGQRAAGHRNGSEGLGTSPSEAGGTDRKESFRTPDNGPLNTVSHTVSPDAATVTRQAEEIVFLRAQLEQRAEEVRRRDQAESELRRLLLSSQQALQMALERPMLPAASETQPAARVRWWQLWRR